jgi:hypothetical protein
MMPYLTNLVYLVGVGAPTIYDTYHGKAPLLHAARWAGVPLTLVSILGGLLVFGVVAASVRHAVRFVRGSRCPEPGSSSALENNAGFRDRDRTRLLLLGVSICYFSGLCLVRFIFDRYLLPFLPIALFFAIDVCPPSVVRSKAALAVVTLVALFSLGAMREYMSWNAARYQVVNRLLATGVANDDVDGGYEINGLLRAIPKAVRGDKDLGNPRDPWWGKKSRYRVSFWIDNPTDCTPVDRQPFWSWPGTGPRAVYMLDCDDTIDWDPLSAL